MMPKKCKDGSAPAADGSCADGSIASGGRRRTLKAKTLRRMLKKKGMKTTGKKATLMKRLHMKGGALGSMPFMGGEDKIGAEGGRRRRTRRSRKFFGMY
jgi:hypothetical protein